MRIYTLSLVCLLTGTIKGFAQQKVKQQNINTPIELNEVVVTGQFTPQSVRNSVYQVRTISSERIRLRGATTVQSVLNTELGLRFSNDPALGTADISLMGMSGQSVKILLDGVPLFDRSEVRESLGQIDINTIDRIEIIEGPMSVVYGSDALAGVINIITKKGAQKDNLSINARVQEETVGKEYSAFSNKGVHNENLNINWERKGWQTTGSISRNNFGGFQGDKGGRAKAWLPKDQWLGSIKLGYRNTNFNIWYRFDGLDETINNLGDIVNNIAPDKDYLSSRLFHQMQAEWQLNDRLSLNGAVTYTDLSRRTRSSNLDIATGNRTLSLDPAAQDKSAFDTKFFRGTAQYKLSPKVSLQPGVEINLSKSTGARIAGTPSINDYAFFVSSEIRPIPQINIRPGLRMIKNSVYNAPPLIPSLNTQISINKDVNLRLGYARGFRAPNLRELYFNFHDSNHSIDGNTNLKAETSNSFNGSITWQAVQTSNLRYSTDITGFYNNVNDQISIGLKEGSKTDNIYLNIDKYKTRGFTFNNTLSWKDLQVTLGLSYIGVSNQLANDPTIGENPPSLNWLTELNSNISYLIPGTGTNVSFFYKYTGKKPAYQAVTDPTTQKVIARLTETDAFHMADATLTKSINKYVSLTAGVKNLFNVTNVNNSSINTGSAHGGASGAIPIGYGRSYFLGLNFQWSKY